MQYNKEMWEPGEVAFFEYHCLESDESADAHLWHRSHSAVEILGPDAGDGWEEAFAESTFAERAEEGVPRVYKVKFSDGLVGSVWEDELMTSERGYYRPDPPNKR